MKAEWEDRRRSPYVFVVGCPRSGTTLLQRMLDHHPLLAVANDTHFIPRAIDPEGGDVPLTPGIVDRVLAYHRFPRLGLPEHAVRRAAAGSGSYADFVSALYEMLASRRSKALGGEKTPDYVRHLPLLNRLFPWTRFLHIVRDGRDVALSALEWASPTKGPGRFALWRDDPVAVCALWWRWQVSLGVDGGRDASGRYLEVRYEDLVTDPGRIMGDVCRFLDLPFAPETVSFHVGREREGPRLSAKSAWRPPTPGLRDWRAQMPGGDVALFEALAGDVLSDLGYERTTGTPSTALRARADRYREWWETELDRRRSKRRAAARP